MNHKEVIIVTIVTSLIVTLSVSYIHAQTLSFSSSNSTITFGFSNSTVPSNSTTLQALSKCAMQVQQQMQSQESSVNQSKAVSLAHSYLGLNSAVQGYEYTFNSIFSEYSWDTNCNVSWTDVNIAYTVSNHTNYVKNVIVSLNPSLSQVLGVREQIGRFYYSTITYNTIWSGYDLAGGNSITPTIYQTFENYTIPAISTPALPNPCRTDLGNQQGCDLAIWTALEDSQGAANDHLAQAGSDETISCTSSTCTTQYTLFYEFLPNAAIFCGNSLMNQGDKITSTVTNQAINAGGDPTKYNISVQDTTVGFGCVVSGNSYPQMNNPIFAAFINERAISSSGELETLASFSSDKISGQMSYNNTSNLIAPHFLDNLDNMYNQGNSNINVTSISGGAFTENYQTSVGTQNTCKTFGNVDQTIPYSCRLADLGIVNGNLAKITYKAAKNLIVQSPAVVTIPNGVTLQINSTAYHLLANSGASVLIQPGGQLLIK